MMQKAVGHLTVQRDAALRVRSLCYKSHLGAKRAYRVGGRRNAVVGTATYVGEPPSPPDPPIPTFSPPPAAADIPSTLDAQILSGLRLRASSADTSKKLKPHAHIAVHHLPELVSQYLEHAGAVLDSSLPYESRPDRARKVPFADDSPGAEGTVGMVVHAVRRGESHKLTHCSGFALGVPGLPAVLVTCAHTFEEIRRHPLLSTPGPAADGKHPREATASGSFIISGAPAAPTITPVFSVLSALHRADLLLLSASPSADSQQSSLPPPALRTLPVSPYPAQPGTRIRAHFVAASPPAEAAEGWRPWVGGTWSKWVHGTVLGYRDFAGREAQPGTYDALAHLLFDPPPTPGSSGGPIVDEETGAVIGVMLGTQMQNRLGGVRGWGVPAEMIFEMFSLPGLKLKNR